MTTTPELGTYGVWRGHQDVSPELARLAESLGFGTIWLGHSPGADLVTTEAVLDATDTVVVATSIINIWSNSAADAAASYHRVDSKHPGRFLLGIGAGHPEAVQQYEKPYDALVAYLDELDELGVPPERRILAALGPKVLKLAADRTAGAHPYLTPPAHSREARDVLGPDTLLAPEHKIVLNTDPEAARTIGRPPVDNPYLHLRNYTNNLHRLGYTDDDIANGGTDSLIDALVAHGTAESIAAQLNAHIAAGADHVGLHVLPDAADPEQTYRALAGALGIA